MKVIVAGWHSRCSNPPVMKKTSTILAIGSGLLFSHAQAEIESEFHVGYNSQYFFRGVDLGDDAYEYGLQVSGSCDCGLDWSAGIWSISPDNGPSTTGVVDELDIFASVSKDFGGVTVATGFTAYTYDGSAPDDAEVFLGLSGEQFGLSYGLTAFFGTDGVLEEQILLEGSLGYSFDINDKVSASVGTTFGYIADEGEALYASEDGKAYFIATFSLDIALSEEITLSPYVSYVDSYGQTINAGTNYADGVIGGAKLSFSF